MTNDQLQELITAMKDKNVMVFADTIKIFEGAPYHKDELPDDIRKRFSCLDCAHRYTQNNVETHCDDCTLDIVNIKDL